MADLRAVPAPGISLATSVFGRSRLGSQVRSRQVTGAGPRPVHKYPPMALCFAPPSGCPSRSEPGDLRAAPSAPVPKSEEKESLADQEGRNVAFP
jgi:hypothetical protein